MKINFMYGVIDTYKQFERTAVTQSHILESQTQLDFEEMRTLEKEKLRRIGEFSQAQNTSRNWGYLSAIANNMMSVVPLVSGSLLIKNKETSIPGYLMIGSGLASITNRIFQSNGIYDKISSWMNPSKDLQETIASRLETGMQFISSVAGVAGGYLAASTGAIASQLASWATNGMSLATQGIYFGRSFTEKKEAHIRSDVQSAESRIQQLYQGLHQKTKESERLTHTITDSSEALKSAIQSLYNTRV